MNKKQILFLMALCAMHDAMAMERLSNPFVASADRAEELWFAATDNNLSRVQELLASGINPNSKLLSHYPLCNVAALGHVEICKALLNSGANANMATQDTRHTPLMSAATYRNLTICKLLLAAGANVNAVNRSDMSPLHYICWDVDRELIQHPLPICELLLQYGADDTLIERHERKKAIDFAREARAVEYHALVPLLGDPAKIHAVIMREDNPNLNKLRRFGPNIASALMFRELGRK